MNDEEIHNIPEWLSWVEFRPPRGMYYGDTFRNIRSGLLYEIREKRDGVVQFYDIQHSRLHEVTLHGLLELFDRGNIRWV